MSCRNLIKNFIVVLCVLSLTTYKISSLQDEGCLTTSQQCINKIIELKEIDQRLKSTWSYQGLVLSKAAYETINQQASSSYLGFSYSLMSVVALHNAPQILNTVGNWLIPTRFQETYKTGLSYVFDAALVYNILNNPLKQASGYFFGAAGLSLVHRLTSDEDNFFQKEIRGLLYFWGREVGFSLYDLSNIYGNLPTPPHQVNATFLQEKTEEVMGMDDNVIVRTPNNQTTKTFIPLCADASLRQESISHFHEKVVPPLLDAYLQAQRENKQLHVLFGTAHWSCSCYWQERELLKWAKSLSIKHAILEVPESKLTSMLKDLSNLKSFKSTSFDLLKPSSTNGWLNLVVQIAHADKLNFTLIAGDPSVDNEHPIWESPIYSQVLKELIDGTYTRDTKFTMVDGEQINLNQCPKFLERERKMGAITNQMNNSFVAIYGAGHLGGLSKRLQKNNKNSSILFMASCSELGAQSNIHNFLFPNFLRRYLVKIHTEKSKIIQAVLLDQAFGKGCGKVYLQSKKDGYYAMESPEVIRSGVAPYKEISYEYDIGSYADSH